MFPWGVLFLGDWSIIQGFYHAEHDWYFMEVISLRHFNLVQSRQIHETVVRTDHRITVGKRNYFRGYRILLHELPVVAGFMCWNCKIWMLWSMELISWSNSDYTQWNWGQFAHRERAAGQYSYFWCTCDPRCQQTSKGSLTYFVN